MLLVCKVIPDEELTIYDAQVVTVQMLLALKSACRVRLPLCLFTLSCTKKAIFVVFLVPHIQTSEQVADVRFITLTHV